MVLTLYAAATSTKFRYRSDRSTLLSTATTGYDSATPSTLPPQRHKAGREGLSRKACTGRWRQLSRSPTVLTTSYRQRPYHVGYTSSPPNFTEVKHSTTTPIHIIYEILDTQYLNYHTTTVGSIPVFLLHPKK